MKTVNTKRVFKLNFAPGAAQADAISATEVVVVWPASDNWNDQGFRLLVQFVIKADGAFYRSGSTRYCERQRFPYRTRLALLSRPFFQQPVAAVV